jgi:hypothetical protein
MKGRIFKAVIILFSWLLWLSLAAADSVDVHLKNLKSEDPEIRAKAAYELGCG